MIIFSNLWINCSFMVKTEELESLTLNLQTFPWGGEGFKNAFVHTTDNGYHMLMICLHFKCFHIILEASVNCHFLVLETPTFRDGRSSRKTCILCGYNVSFVATMCPLQLLFLEIEVKEKTNIL